MKDGQMRLGIMPEGAGRTGSDWLNPGMPLYPGVARRSGWFVSGNQDGDPDALGWMIVAPDCRWQVVFNVSRRLA